MRDPNVEKITAALGVRGGGTTEHAGLPSDDPKGGEYIKPSIPHMDYGEGINLDYLEGVLRNVVSQAGLKDDVRIAQAGSHLKLIIDNNNTPRAIKALAPRLMLLSNRLTLVSIPESGGGWSQSLAEAEAAAKMMHESGYRKSFAALAGGAGDGPALEIHIEADDGRLR
jgi:hypothetical protein